jgi:hypothetical protein
MKRRNTVAIVFLVVFLVLGALGIIGEKSYLSDGDLVTLLADQ